jgi:hypothetical protein
MLAQLTRGRSEQGSDRRLAGERLAVPRWGGQLPDGPRETGSDAARGAVSRVKVTARPTAAAVISAAREGDRKILQARLSVLDATSIF